MEKTAFDWRKIIIIIILILMGSPTELGVLWDRGAVLPQAPHPTAAPLPLNPGVAPSRQRSPRLTPQGQARPVLPPSIQQQILPFLHPKAAGKQQVPHSAPGSLMGDKEPSPQGAALTSPPTSPTGCCHPTHPPAPLIPHLNNLLQPETARAPETSPVPAACRLSIPTGDAGARPAREASTGARGGPKSPASPCWSGSGPLTPQLIG